MYTPCVHFETVHTLYTPLITWNSPMPTCAVCILYTIHSIYIQCLLGHLVQPYIHTLPCHAPIIQSLQVAKEREKRMRKQLKALHYEATILLCTMKPPPLLAAHKIPEVPTNAQKLVLTRTLTTCPPFLFI